MRIHGYTLLRELGRGGTSTVHLAIEDATGRQVALKVLAPELTHSATALARLRAEARTSTRLDHPAIVRVFGIEHDDDLHFIVTEYVEGTTLARVLSGEGSSLLDRQDPVRVARFFALLAGALAHAHEAGVLHRDVKPSNVLIDQEGRPRLTDFGMARGLGIDDLTRTGSLVGTIAYMSPEQCRGGGTLLDGRSDLFSLGVVLYETLTGEHPFEDPSPLAVLRAITESDVVAPRRLRSELPSDLQTICLKCLEKDPRDRYAHATELERDLLAFADGRAIDARGPSWARRWRVKFRRRRRRAIAAGALALVALVALGLGRELRGNTGTTVLLRSEPPGIEVYARRLQLEDLALDAPVLLGRTPTRVSLDPGPVRFVFMAPDGRFAELFRWIPERLPSRRAAAFEVAATLHTPEHAPRDMIQIEGMAFEAGYEASPTNPFPKATVRVASFEIDAHEVTIAEFERFLRATGQPRPTEWGDAVTPAFGDRPAAGVTWELAQQYAEWAGKRLPTLLEFERAARGVDGRLHPWPDAEAPADSVRVWAVVDRLGERPVSASMRDAALFTELVGPVGSHPRDRTDDGVFDLLGSVSEWVETPWILVGSDGERSFAPRMRILKSSNWAMQHPLTHLGIMVPRDVSAALGMVSGFRCVRSIDPLAVNPPAP